MGTGPIFIGGLSYSGKTYLRLMLLAHPNLMITRHTKMWPRYYGRFGHLANEKNFERCLETMLRAKQIQTLHPDPKRIRREFWQGPPTYAHLFALFHAHHAEQAGKPRWGDQLGQIETYADAIFAAYPAAKMIHMVRDPRPRTAESVATSRYRRAKVGWETAAWRRSVHLAVRNNSKYADRYQVVYYEDLLSYPEEMMRKVCAFLNESFVPQMLTVEGVPGLPQGITTNGTSDLVTNREIALLQSSVSKEMMDHNYLPQPLHLSIKDYISLPIIDWPLNLAGQALWWAKEGRQNQ